MILLKRQTLKDLLINLCLSNLSIASLEATHAPLIEAVLVPPSADITSQSILSSLSPNKSKSKTFLMLLPISLCISSSSQINVLL